MTIAVTNIGTTSGTTASAITIAIPGGGVPAHATIIVAITDANAAGTIPSAPTDTVNTYTVTITSRTIDALNADGIVAVAYSGNVSALTSANTISYTPVSSSGASMTAFYVTGVLPQSNPINAAATATSDGSSAAPSVTMAGALTAIPSLLVGVIGVKGAATHAFTQDSTHAAYATPPTLVTSTTNWQVAGGSVIRTATTAIAYAPTITSAPWGAIIFAIQGAATPTGVNGHWWCWCII